MKILKFVALCALAGTLSCSLGCKSDSRSSAAAATGGKPYPLTKCVVSEEPLDAGKTYTFVRDGQEVKLCCKDCLPEFEKDPKKYMAKINDAK